MPWYLRFQNVFRAERLSAELDDELAFHLAETADRLMQEESVSTEEAWRQARLLLGNYLVQKERTRDMDIAGWLDALRADLTYGLRQLRLNPGFATVAVLSLALGIGANTAIFQMLDAIRLRGLPVADPARLVSVERSGKFLTAGWYASREEAFTYAQMQALKQRQTAFSDMLTFWPTRFNLSTSGRSRYAEGLLVSANFFKVLGVTPIAGAGFPALEDRVACSSAPAVLSYAFWQRELGGDFNAIGRTINLDGHQFIVAGITPASFFGVEPGHRFDVALPLCADNVFAKDSKGRVFNRIAYWLTPMGRLKTGWTVERTSAQIRDLSPAIFRETMPTEYRPELAKAYLKNQLKAVPANAGVSSLRGDYENPLWILMALTGSVLLIACANLANLLLARASSREREMAVRQAVGAWRGRLIMQLLLESLLLGITGAALGLVLALALSRTLVAFLSTSNQPVVLTLGIDWHLFGFLCILALGTSVFFGLVPAIRASSTTPARAMRGSRTTTANRERNGLRRTLVVSQVALSLILLVAALLFTTSLRKLLATSLGFDSHNVLVADITANGPGFEKPERRNEIYRELESRFQSIPAVQSASSAGFTPFSGYGWNGSVHSDNDAARSGGKDAWFNRVGSRYFSTLGTPLLEGRSFTDHDDMNAPKVAIVNQTFAKRLFAGRSPVGRTFRVEEGSDKPDSVYQIVGVTGDTRYNQFAEEQHSIAFFPMGQDDQPGNDLNYLIRTRGSLEQTQPAIQRQVATLNANLLVDFRLLDVQIQESVLRERLMANLSLAFGVLAASLSALGLYGVTSYMVSRRRGEIGLRIALGATRSTVYALIAKDVAMMLGIGLLAGVIASLSLSRYADSLLYNLKGRDPVTMILAVTLLIATATLATLLPARRAARLDPISTLREE